MKTNAQASADLVCIMALVQCSAFFLVLFCFLSYDAVCLIVLHSSPFRVAADSVLAEAEAESRGKASHGPSVASGMFTHTHTPIHTDIELA